MTNRDPGSWKAFVLAAGLGQRMRPLTDTLPKPLIKVAGRALIDHGLDRLAGAGIREAIVNVHYLADLLEAHLKSRTHPKITISDERRQLLETGGGITRALPTLGSEPFLVLNSDSIWWEAGKKTALSRMMECWEEARMDALLLLVEREKSTGYDGAGDFLLTEDGRLKRRGEAPRAAIYMGVGIFHPRLFARAPKGAFSLNLLFDASIRKGRLHGMMLDGEWMHVGTPQAVIAAERRMSQLEGKT